jgi:hypothetical protein
MSPDLQIKGRSAPNSSKPPKLREVRFDDDSQVAALAVKFRLDADDFRAWKSLSMDNPTFRETSVAVRDRETLEWHFKFALRKNIAWIYLLEDRRGLERIRRWERKVSTTALSP